MEQNNNKRILNFSAGPAIMPLPVLEQVQAEFTNYKSLGASVMEMSHRDKIFAEIHKDSQQRLRSLANIPQRFDILYMTGGASTQFALIPMNLSSPGSTSRQVAYVNTGIWAQKAIEQAKLQKRNVHIAASSEDQNFSYIPHEIKFGDKADYLHITSNNTIFGTEYLSWPSSNGTKLIVDMSSNFLSKPIDWQSIGLAYAGLQKNAGPSGLTVVIIDSELYAREKEDTPTMFRYSTFAKSQSLYNTPPTFQIYFFSLVLKWIESLGGLEKLELLNQDKAQLLYDVIDRHPEFYLGHAKKEDRSVMNITWNFHDPSLDAIFLKGAEARGMYGLKGHRMVGGLRASIYNAAPKKACQELAEYMNEFCQQQTLR